MMKKSMFERDLLYPTEKIAEPGSVHVTVYQPENSGGIPVLIEAKTAHNPLDYISDIVALLQADVFDRTRIDIKKTGLIYFKTTDGLYRLKYLDKGEFSVERANDF
jgi:hypothetical protein